MNMNMNRMPLASEVEHELINLIKTEYEPGSKIPIETELSEIFNVSRTTVRAAVKALVSRNILEIRRGDGTYVSRKPGLSPDALGLSFLDPALAGKDLRDFTKIFQPVCAQWAAQRYTDQDAFYINKVLDEYDEAYSEYKAGKIGYTELRKKDTAFHTTIIRASHNILMARMDTVFKEFSRRNEIPNEIVVENSYLLHRKIGETILARNAELAKELMYEHVSTIEVFFGR